MDSYTPTRSKVALLLAVCLPAISFSAGCRATTAPRAVTQSQNAAKPLTVHPDRQFPGGGIYHRLERGQTLSDLSRAYQVPVKTLIQVNGIRNPASIPAQTPIFVPGAERLLAIPTDALPALAWPLHGRITTGFNTGGRHRHHEGLDIDGELGQPIRAAASGSVIHSGRDGRYGNALLIDHGDGLATFYAHASKLLVRAGDQVRQGEPIAEVGHSGNARGTHLHFEARRNGRPVDPLQFLHDSRTVPAARR